MIGKQRFKSLFVSALPALVLSLAFSGYAPAATFYEFDASWGGTGAKATSLDYPRDIEIGLDGTVYVLNYGTLKTFTADGVFTGRFDEGDIGYYPNDMALDGLGHIYVLQNRPTRIGDDWHVYSYIHKFEVDGTFLSRWGPFNEITVNSYGSTITSIAVGPSGGIFLTEPRRNRLIRLNPDGSEAGRWEFPVGTLAGQFQEDGGPWKVMLDSSGNVYLDDYTTDLRGRRIQVFSPAMVLIENWLPHLQSRAEGEIFNRSLPGHIDSEDNIFLLGYGEHPDGEKKLKVTRRVEMYNPQRQLVTTWGTDGMMDGQLRHPLAIASDAAGSIYVTDYMGSPPWADDRVSRFTRVVDPACVKPGSVKIVRPSLWAEARPNFEWQAETEAKSYRIRVMEDRVDDIYTVPTGIFMERTVSGTLFKPGHSLPVPADRSYYEYWWAVRACNGCGCGEWSDTWLMYVMDDDTVPPVQPQCDPTFSGVPVRVDIRAEGHGSSWPEHSKSVDGSLKVSVGVEVVAAADGWGDWWLRAIAPGGRRFWFTLGRGWVSSPAPVRAYAGPVRNIRSQTVLDTAKIPNGEWRFDFGLDKRDGALQWSACDTLNVRVRK